MLEERYLLGGLDALSRAYKTDYFADGHRGAAIISAYYLCQRSDLEAGVVDVIRALIDENWMDSDLCAPFPEETPEPVGVARIAQSLERNMVGLRQVGHNVIFPSLALRALRQLPETVTPLRTEGICRLVEAFSTVADIHLEEDDDIPDIGAPPVAAEFILSELLRTMRAFEGRGQGWSGHLLTYGRALLDLRQLGFGALARKGEQGFRLYIKRIRLGPLDTDKPRPEHPPSELLPHEVGYWRVRSSRGVGIGHLFKYPYGFYGWVDHLQDTDLRRRCKQAAYHIF